jgi:hypothetical protein
MVDIDVVLECFANTLGSNEWPKNDGAQPQLFDKMTHPLAFIPLATSSALLLSQADLGVSLSSSNASGKRPPEHSDCLSKVREGGNKKRKTVKET